MKRLVIKPSGWPCALAVCPPGHFIFNDKLCFKSKYFKESGGKIYSEVYNEIGDILGDRDNFPEDRESASVQHVFAEWEEYDG
jgi:hypothetical protein